MTRPPLPLGQHGEISVAPKRGQWVARCRLRGFDGVTRKMERAGRTRTAARRALQDELTLPPGCSSRLPGLTITRHHQGFTCVHPSGLPLARSFPRTERGPLGFFPELRTPTGRTYGRTSGRGPISNTDRELRTRHNRPPNCAFTQHARPRVAPHRSW